MRATTRTLEFVGGVDLDDLEVVAGHDELALRRERLERRRRRYEHVAVAGDGKQRERQVLAERRVPARPQIGDEVATRAHVADLCLQEAAPTRVAHPRARRPEEDDVARARREPRIVHKGTLDDETTHAVRDEGERRVAVERLERRARPQVRGQRREIGIRGPHAAHVGREAGAVADAEHVPLAERGVGNEVPGEVAPRSLRVPGEAVDEHDRGPRFFAHPIRKEPRLVERCGDAHDVPHTWDVSREPRRGPGRARHGRDHQSRQRRRPALGHGCTSAGAASIGSRWVALRMDTPPP